MHTYTCVCVEKYMLFRRIMFKFLVLKYCKWIGKRKRIEYGKE